MDLTNRNTHFEFGANWRDYSQTIDSARIESAVQGVRKLFPDGLTEKTFLDIGCGSGLHSLAALTLGASHVVATDIDENSVDTARSVLSRAPEDRWEAREQSVFNMTPESTGSSMSFIPGASCTIPATCGGRSRLRRSWLNLVVNSHWRFIRQRRSTRRGRSRSASTPKVPNCCNGRCKKRSSEPYYPPKYCAVALFQTPRCAE